MQKSEVKRWILLVKSSSFADTHFEIEKAEVVIGRVRGCDLTIRSEAVSRRHVRLSSFEGKLFVEDLKSSNGVVLNGKKIPPACVIEIQPGQSIGLGTSKSSVTIERVEYTLDTDAPSSTAPSAPIIPQAPGEAAGAAPPAPVPAVAPALPLDAAPQADGQNQTHAQTKRETIEELPPSQSSVDVAELLAQEGNVDIEPVSNALPMPSPEAPEAFFEAPAHPHREHTNLSRVFKRQEFEAGVKAAQAELEEARLKLARTREEEESYLQIKAIEKRGIESELRDLGQKQLKIKESYGHNERVLAKQNETLEKVQTQVAAAETTLARQSTSIVENENRLAGMAAEITHRREEGEGLARELKTQQTQRVSAEAELARLREEVARVEQTLREQLKTQSRESDDFENLKKRHGMDIAYLQAELKLTETRSLTAIEEKKAELVKLERERDATQNSLHDLRQELEAARLEKEQLLRAIKEQSQSAQQLGEKNQDAQSHLTELEQRRDENQRLAVDAEAKRRLVEQNLTQLREDLERQRTEMAEAKSRADREVAELRGMMEADFAASVSQSEAARERQHLERMAALESDFRARTERLEQESEQERREAREVLNREKSEFVEESRRKMARERLEHQKGLDTAQKRFDDATQESRRLSEREVSQERERTLRDLRAQRERSQLELRDERTRTQNELARLKREHEDEIARGLQDFRQQKVRESELRERLFVDGAVSSFFEAAKVTGADVSPRVAPELEHRVRGLLKSLYLASDEASLKSLESDKPWLKMSPKVSKFERYQRPLTYASLACTVILLGYLVVGRPGGGLRGWATAQEEAGRKSFESKMALSRAEANRPFDPPRDRIYKGSYTDNILYLEGYAENVMNDAYRKNWILRVQHFFTKEIPGGDRRAPQFLAAEGSLVDDLLKMRAGVNAKNPDPGIKRMRELEDSAMEKLVDLAGTPKQWDRIRQMEQQYFSEQNFTNTLRSPASSGDSKPSD